MIIYFSQPFSGYNWAWKPKTSLDIAHFFLLIEQNNLISYSEAAKALCRTCSHSSQYITYLCYQIRFIYDKISKNFWNDVWMLETLFVVVPIGCGVLYRAFVF